MTRVSPHRRQRISYGDFQTPQLLADEVSSLLRTRGCLPNSIVEPTCGHGSFLLAAADAFPAAQQIVGAEINDLHLSTAAARVRERSDAARFRLAQSDFFRTDWSAELAALPEPILVVGNPPWVTNATQGSLESDNLPVKRNASGRRGIDALTGHSNFDVSEWMLSRLFDGLNGRRGVLAMLCKTAVARRALTYAWQKRYQLREAELHPIDAQREFGAAVKACLLIAEFAADAHCDFATVFPAVRPLGHCASTEQIGWRDGRLVANLCCYTRQRHLCAEPDPQQGASPRQVQPLWRSGIKHDCSPVMELVAENGRLRNGLEEEVDVEPECLFPLLKSGDIAAGQQGRASRWLILPQRFVGEDTSQLERIAPRLWQYLQSHLARFEARRSSIYRRQPQFAIFGIGEYTFAPWKVVVSGLAKRLRFSVVGPVNGQPYVLDDTGYFLPCSTEDEATKWAELLNSPTATEFFSAFIFWDAKRPVTAELLRRLDLGRLTLDTHLAQSVDGALDDAEQGGVR